MIKRGAAHLISFALNPVFATAITLAVALLATPTDQKRSWLSLILLLNIFIPFILISALIKGGFALDDTLENTRVKRDRLYAIYPLVAIGILEWWLAYRQEIGQPLVATIVATTLLTTVMATISYSWKISHHLTNISALVFVAGLVYSSAAIWLLLIIPIVAWARIKLHRHTARQVIGGIILAPAVVLPIFYFYGLL